jgi:N-acetylglutamate synthase-like GNAT family acetyltransferase
MIKIRDFESQDARAVSFVIRETMRISNNNDYSLDILEPLIEYFSPEKIIQLSKERRCLIAEKDGQIVGTIAIEAAELCTFFVHPDFQRKGIGTKLLKAVEKSAFADGIRKIKVDSSITAVPFYKKSGYRKTGIEKEATAGRQIEMEKILVR